MSDFGPAATFFCSESSWHHPALVEHHPALVEAALVRVSLRWSLWCHHPGIILPTGLAYPVILASSWQLISEQSDSRNFEVLDIKVGLIILQIG